MIIPFPGAKPESPIVITEDSQIDGKVIKIGGRDKTIPLLLLGENGVAYRCTILGENLAKEIAAYYLGATIRIYGRGKWKRTTAGDWELENLAVSSFQELSENWDSALHALQAVASGWADADIQAECARLRRG